MGNGRERALELLDEMYQCRLESYKISFIEAISDMRSASCERRHRSYPQRRLESKMVSLNTTINICEESGQCKNALELATRRDSAAQAGVWCD